MRCKKSDAASGGACLRSGEVIQEAELFGKASQSASRNHSTCSERGSGRRSLAFPVCTKSSLDALPPPRRFASWSCRLQMPEQIVAILRRMTGEAEKVVCRSVNFREATLYCWKQQHGALELVLEDVTELKALHDETA